MVDLAVVGSESKASEWVEKRREGNGGVRRGRSNGLDHGKGSMVLVELGREEMKGCGGDKVCRGWRWLLLDGGIGRQEGRKQVAVEFERVER